MNSYEMLYILKPDMDEEARAALIQKIAEFVTENGGEVENTEEWGIRKLAYAIDYITEGYYVLVNFKANADYIVELNRRMRINENVMRNMVLVKEA